MGFLKGKQLGHFHFCLPSQSGLSQTGKTCFFKSKFFPFTVDHMLVGLRPLGNNEIKSYSPLYFGGKARECTHPLKVTVSSSTNISFYNYASTNCIRDKVDARSRILKAGPKLRWI